MISAFLSTYPLPYNKLLVFFTFFLRYFHVIQMNADSEPKHNHKNNLFTFKHVFISLVKLANKYKLKPV